MKNFYFHNQSPGYCDICLLDHFSTNQSTQLFSLFDISTIHLQATKILQTEEVEKNHIDNSRRRRKQ